MIEFSKQELLILVTVLDKAIQKLEKQGRDAYPLTDSKKLTLYARIQDKINETDALAIRISNLLRDKY